MTQPGLRSAAGPAQAAGRATAAEVSPGGRADGIDVDLVVCDLDGVVYRGQEACAGAVTGLRAIRDAGIAVSFLTNNAGHTRDEVVAKLRGFGVAATKEEVLTSSWITAQWLAGQRRDGRYLGPVLAVGGPGVLASLRECGVEAVGPQEHAAGHHTAAVVVQGYGTDLTVAQLREATYAVAAGATWIATNDDATLPTERGQAPGNGSYLALVAHATGRSPDLVVGKPHPTAYRLILERSGFAPERILAVGDRLDTDIDGAVNAGLRTALVLTGVDTEHAAAARPPQRRPEFVLPTLMDLPLVQRG